MIMLKKPTAIVDFVKKNKNLFEDVAKNYQNVHSANDVAYTVLDYEKIMNEIYSYLTSFIEYNKKGDNKYADKIITMTKGFYDNMFKQSSAEKYRRIISLCDFPYITEKFLEIANKLQKLFDEMATSKDKDTLQILYMSNNQVTKLTHVFHDDMKIYKWLSLSGSKVFNGSIDDNLRLMYLDKSTPVMHVK